MQLIRVLIAGYTDGQVNPNLLKVELQRVIERYAPFAGYHLEVEQVRVQPG